MKQFFKLSFLLVLLTASRSLFAQDNNPRWQPDFFPQPLPGEGYFAFYDGENATGNLVMKYGAGAVGHTADVNFQETHPSGGNDKIRSIVIVGPFTGGTNRLWLFDNPSGQTDDDYMSVTVNGYIPAGTRVVIGEIGGGAAPVYWYGGPSNPADPAPSTNTVVTQLYYHNGLAAKVSRISRYNN